MSKNIIKVGTIVQYRGGFGADAPTIVKVTSIEKSQYKRDKYGKPVKSVPFAEKDYCVFTLDNHHWCYGEQIDSIVESENEPETMEVPVSIIEDICKYCEDKAIWDKLGVYHDFYYKLKQLKREHDFAHPENVLSGDEALAELKKKMDAD